MNRGSIAVILHFLFWIFNLTVNVAFSDLPLWKEAINTLLFTVPFYLNYFVLVPKILHRITAKRIALWFFSFMMMHVGIVYPFYEFIPSIFQTPNMVSGANILGGIIHISFYYMAFSTGSRVAIEWVKNIKRSHELFMEKTTKEIKSLKSEMSFPFVKNVLDNLEGVAQEDPSQVVRPMSSLAKVLRFKLYRNKDESIMLSDEAKVIENYLSLLSSYDNSKWLLKVKNDQWIEPGMAFITVERYIEKSPKKGGVIVLHAEDEKVRITEGI